MFSYNYLAQFANVVSLYTELSSRIKLSFLYKIKKSETSNNAYNKNSGTSINQETNSKF